MLLAVVNTSGSGIEWRQLKVTSPALSEGEKISLGVHRSCVCLSGVSQRVALSV